MNVCFFGSYNPNYSRNKILIDGLQKNGITVFHCRSQQGSFLKRYPELFKKYFNIYKRIDILYVAFVGHLDMPLAWLLAKSTGKKVVFDMFYSMYDTYVYDRQSMKKESFRAQTYFWIDKIAATLADLIITDTRTHGDYFIRTFHLNPRKFHRIFVGGDDTLFRPVKQKKRRDKIIVEFHGMFTRLSGAEYFVEAAKKLEKAKNIEFWLIGSSTNYYRPLELYQKLKPKNMKYFSELSVEALAKKIAQCDISVGHIGKTEKAKSVISNKMFHAFACRVAVIAGNCKASKELLTNKQNALFVTMASTTDLCEGIKFLAKNKKIRLKIANKGYELARETLSNKFLGGELRREFEQLLRT